MAGRIRYPLVHGGIDTLRQVTSTMAGFSHDFIDTGTVYKALSFGSGPRYITAKLELIHADPYKSLGIVVFFMRKPLNLLKRIRVGV